MTLMPRCPPPAFSVFFSLFRRYVIDYAADTLPLRYATLIYCCRFHCRFRCCHAARLMPRPCVSFDTPPPSLPPSLSRLPLVEVTDAFNITTDHLHPPPSPPSPPLCLLLPPPPEREPPLIHTPCRCHYLDFRRADFTAAALYATLRHTPLHYAMPPRRFDADIIFLLP